MPVEVDLPGVRDLVIALVQLRRLPLNSELHKTLVRVSPNTVCALRSLYAPIEIISAVKEVIKSDPNYKLENGHFKIFNPDFVRIFESNRLSDQKLMSKLLPMMCRLNVHITSDELSGAVVMTTQSAVSQFEQIEFDPSCDSASLISYSYACDILEKALGDLK